MDEKYQLVMPLHRRASSIFARLGLARESSEGRNEESCKEDMTKEKGLKNLVLFLFIYVFISIFF